MKLKSSLFNIMFYLFVIILLSVELIPFFTIIIGSIKPNDELFDPSKIIPTRIELIRYTDAPGEGMMTKDFFIQLRNSLIISATAALLIIGSATLSSYALARLNFRFSKTFAQLILFSYLFPGAFLIFPLTFLMMQYGLYNNLASVILAETTISSPFAIWLLTGYFTSIPKEIEESALIDGCNRLQVILKVVMPLSIPALIAVFMYTFIRSWNNYLFPLILLNNKDLWTLPIGISCLLGSEIVV